ncbi:hypothetical protein Hanom_Chr05g00420811 [Helianthus anomalus]
MSLSTKSSVFLTSGSESSKLSVFVHRVADPVDPWIVANSSMCRVHQDYFKVLVGRVLHSKLVLNAYSFQRTICIKKQMRTSLSQYELRTFRPPNFLPARSSATDLLLR